MNTLSLENINKHAPFGVRHWKNTAKVRILIQDTKSIGLNLHISRLFCNFAVASKDFAKDQSAGQKVVVK
jgi:hypothetical protein